MYLVSFTKEMSEKVIYIIRLLCTFLILLYNSNSPGLVSSKNHYNLYNNTIFAKKVFSIMKKIDSFYKSSNGDNTLIEGNCIDVLRKFEFKFNIIFADPPYFLSNGGISIHNGKIVCVDKGEWDKGGTSCYIDEFNRQWISICKNKLTENGTIWISGTYHNIFSIAKILNEQKFKLLNILTWAKTDPPENISHRIMTHSSEFIIWAKKTKNATHQYNYEIMRMLNNNRQMTDVWYMPAVQKWEKSCGKHPTQKPLALLSRIILASTQKGDWILDPFNGSGTTGIAANILQRNYLGIEQEIDFLKLSARRREEINNLEIKKAYQERILLECQSNNIIKNKNNVLIGRIGSKEQWNWLLSSHQYNLPINKILSMPQLLGIEYLLACYNNEIKMFKVGYLKPQIKSKEQIQKLSNNNYIPKRDNLYWVIHLVNDNSLNLNYSNFKRKKIISSQQERGVYWLRNLDDVIAAFK